MKKAILIALVICTLFSIACTSNSWKITSKVDCDEFPVYTLRGPNGQIMTGTPAGGSKKLPPIGTKCILQGMIFDCGKYQDLNAYYPPPV